VAVGIAYHAGTAITAVTIGGNSANQATSAAAQTDQGEGTDVWDLAVSSGTTADIVVTLNSTGAIHMAVFVYAVNGTGTSFAAGNGTFLTAGNTTMSQSVTVPSGGGTIGIAAVHTASQTIAGSTLTMDINNETVGGSTYGSGNDTSHSGSVTCGWLVNYR
jgi:Zn-dependent alcohol dehydrogenase